MNQEEIGNLNRQFRSIEIKTITTYLLTNKGPVPDGFTGEYYQEFREELTRSLLKLFQKTKEEGKLPKSFYKATITLIPKPDKDVTKKKKKHTHKKKTTGQYY